jgi:uncharacterized protein YycO
MKVLIHSGPGVVSRLIRLQTRSRWNHASLLFDDGTVIESREWKGVIETPVGRVLEAMWNEPLLRVSIYEFVEPLTEEEKMRGRAFAEEQRGLPYDYLSVARFISRRCGGFDDRWFCSELVGAACVAAGRPLFRETQAWEIPPGWLPRSLALRFLRDLR